MSLDKMSKNAVSVSALESLLEIMHFLRDPQKGCPWDVEQDFSSISRYTVEEAYEVQDAIERENWPDLEEELGDLLLQVVFHAQMAKEKQLFTFSSIVQKLSEKLLRRHPHVFSEESTLSHLIPRNERLSVDEIETLWEEIKQQERSQKKQKENTPLLESVTLGLPALLRAYKLQKKASKVGFDWPKNNLDPLKEKILEELKEVEEASSDENRFEEIGDLLFAVTNYARHLNIDPENALESANKKFTRRFTAIEEKLSTEGKEVKEQSLETLDTLWNEIKETERASS